MNTLIVCAIIAALLPYLAKAPVAIAMNKLDGYDNRHPRAQQSKLTGFGARALAAHQNSFESLLIFTIALVVVFASNTITATTETLAIIYLIARVIYCVLLRKLACVTFKRMAYWLSLPNCNDGRKYST